MTSHADDGRMPMLAGNAEQRVETGVAIGAQNWQLRCWQVACRSAKQEYAVGQFLPPHAAAAIQRAVKNFGPGEASRAEEIPWDAAPLPRMNHPRLGG